VRHLTHLVNDLLDVSRVTSGHAALDLQWMDLADSVHAAAEQVAPLVARKAQALQVQLPDAAVLMRGDPARMTQVLANLLTNAAKYTPAYGHITVAVDVQDGMARIDVADDGIGMSADLLPQVFELFVQAEPTPDREEGGLGIGLALVRSLVQLHGGRVEAHSDGPGLGSRFRMCLPCEVTVPA
jgi:signal transduction histidine kinase